MSSITRVAIAAALLTSLGGVAQADALHHARASTAHHRAVIEGRSVTVSRVAPEERAVAAPSETQTVMGLAVPR